MSRRRRTGREEDEMRASPPPESMAGSLLMSLGLVGILIGAGLVSFLGLGWLLLGHVLVGGPDGLLRLDRCLRGRRSRNRCGLLGRRLARPVGLRRHRLLPNQFDDGHRGVVA